MVSMCSIARIFLAMQLPSACFTMSVVTVVFSFVIRSFTSVMTSSRIFFQMFSVWSAVKSSSKTHAMSSICVSISGVSDMLSLGSMPAHVFRMINRCALMIRSVSMGGVFSPRSWFTSTLRMVAMRSSVLIFGLRRSFSHCAIIEPDTSSDLPSCRCDIFAAFRAACMR